MIERGRPVKKIQTVPGHSSIAMTMEVDRHLFTEAADDVELFEKIEEDLMAA